MMNRENCSDVTLYGIFLSSRHGSLKEIRELMDFAEAAGRAGVARYIESVFYDSVCGTAYLKTKTDCPVVGAAVESIATLTISQFEIDDWCLHGRDEATPKERGDACRMLAMAQSLLSVAPPQHEKL